MVKGKEEKRCAPWFFLGAYALYVTTKCSHPLTVLKVVVPLSLWHHPGSQSISTWTQSTPRFSFLSVTLTPSCQPLLPLPVTQLQIVLSHTLFSDACVPLSASRTLYNSVRLLLQLFPAGVFCCPSDTGSPRPSLWPPISFLYISFPKSFDYWFN